MSAHVVVDNALNKLQKFGIRDCESAEALTRKIETLAPNVAKAIASGQLAERCLSMVGSFDDSFNVEFNRTTNHSGATVPGAAATCVERLFSNTVSSITSKELAAANRGFKALWEKCQAPQRPFDGMQNELGLPYHCANRDDGKQMAHTTEMAVDVGSLYTGMYPETAKCIAYLHDIVQIKQLGLGVGNTHFTCANELLSAAVMAEGAQGCTDEERRFMAKVAAAVNLPGTFFSFIAQQGRKPILGTVVELLASEQLLTDMRDKALDRDAAGELIAMTVLISLCDTGRHMLKGVPRPTNDEIQERAPQFHSDLLAWAQLESTPELLRQLFTEQGVNGGLQLSEAGCALAQKIFLGVEMFKEFPLDSKSVNGGKGNPLSVEYGRPWTPEDRKAFLDGIGSNGWFGAESPLKRFPASQRAIHPALEDLPKHCLYPADVNSSEVLTLAFQSFFAYVGGADRYGSPEAMMQYVESISQVGGASISRLATFGR
ncbi:hypothetical protein [Pseudomonas entomophila]|uniref:hypothetical protein n=1 Tax=Pseudomonas entomophila TaxID=312306 RepID=UPI001F01242C|nr:hypothetical protein [Pseudomonas entomophila]MCG8291445.1 hypothetical protein [Pseudomonas entomophila]